jgi:uncharacterized membrane protein YfcA
VTAGIAAALGAVAALYSSVGHAGASGYLAVLALAEVAPDRMKPMALALNVLVASLGTWNFRHAAEGRGRVLVTLLLGSVPMAWAFGRMAPGPAYRPALGVVLGLAALWLLLRPSGRGEERPLAVPPATGLFVGAAVGAMAGWTGTGGGIFLTPVLVLTGWASPRQSAAVTAPFILANSLAGLVGALRTVPAVAEDVALGAVAVILGGGLGSWLGANRVPERPLRLLMAVVLAVAAAHLLAAGR